MQARTLRGREGGREGRREGRGAYRVCTEADAGVELIDVLPGLCLVGSGEGPRGVAGAPFANHVLEHGFVLGREGGREGGGEGGRGEGKE